MISCPHIERASTAETYQDRVLGENRAPVAPAFTIMAFTGNNIGPKSDQSSRSLEVRLTTDRCDPENREFKHPDPIGWTRDHRGKILGALYTILLGNPQFKERRPAETRFKEWWNLIGSAVEYANNEAPKKPGPHISFMQMFARTEAKDEDAIERADIIQTLYAIKGDAEFTAVSLHEHLAKSASGAELGKPEEPGAVELRALRDCRARSRRAEP